MKHPLLTIPLAASIAFVSCNSNEPKKSPQADNSTPPPAAEASGGIHINAKHPSPHFETILSQLDVGGKSLHYTDHDGQREMWIGLLDLLLQQGNQLDLPTGLDAAAIIDQTGLASAAASGHSLAQDGDDQWLMRHYIYYPDGLPASVGIWGEARTLQMATTLPAATDLGLEMQLDTRHLPETIRNLAAVTGYTKQLEAAFSEKLPIGMTTEELLAQSKLHLLLGLELMQTESPEMPAVPKSWIIKIQATPKLVAACLPLINQALGEPTTNGQDQSWPLPVPAMTDKKPTFILRGDDTIIAASSAEYVAQLHGDQDKLGTDPIYQSATNHFPDKGNFQAYLSPKVASAARAWIEMAAAQEPDMASMVKALKNHIPDQPWSICVSPDQTGIQTLVEMPFAIDANATTGAMTMASATSVMFVGARAWKSGADRSTCYLNIRNVQQAVRGHQNIFSLNTGDPLTWKIIEDYLAKPTCPDGGTYTLSPTIPPVGKLACTCSLPEHQLDPKDHADW